MFFPNKHFRFCAALLITFLLFFSCATSPKIESSLSDSAPDFSVLPKDASLYLWIDTLHARPLLDALSSFFMERELSGRDVSRILDMTDYAMVAFYRGASSPAFHLAGQGNYPSFRAGFSMIFNRDWKKKKSETGNRYWYSKRNELGLALGKKISIVSSTDPFSPGQETNPAPEAFEEFRRSCVLSGWLNDPSETINRFIFNLGVPIQIPAEEFYFGAVRAAAGNGAQDGGGEPWELVFKVKVSSASQARSLLSIFSIARLFMQRGAPEERGKLTMNPQDAAALLFANVPQVDDAYLTIRTGTLEAEEIALLFNMFSVYSD